MVLGLRLLMRTPPRKIRKKYTAYYYAATMLNYLSYIPLGLSFPLERRSLIVLEGSAFLPELVAQLPDSVETHIGERGAKLSGRQKQRTRHRPCLDS